MGIPTGGPQQGKNPSEGGVPTGRTTPGNQPPAQSRQRPTGLPPQTTPSEDRLPSVPQRSQPTQQRPSSAPSAQRTPPRAQPVQRPQAPAQRQEPLPSAPDEQFDDPFGFTGEDDDLFSDVPKSAYENDSEGPELNEDDPFEFVPDERADSDDESRYEPEPVVAVAPAPAKAPAAKPRRLQGNNRAPERAKAASEEYSEEFVDKENLKLKPFGGRPKKKAKVGDFDARKNMESQRKIYRGVFIAAVLAVVSFGAYQTFWPQQSLSTAQVENIAALAVGDTGFPTTRGEGFAQSFTASLLNVSSGDDDATAKRTAALGYFYGAGGNPQDFDSALTTVGNISQQVVYGPVILDSTPLTANAASYEVGVLLDTRNTDAAKAEGSEGVDQDASAMRWVAFNVNVYYDKAKDTFAIAPNSPSLLPPPAVESVDSVPAAEPLGTAVDQIPESVKATVVGFLSGYRESSKSNTDKILQYIGTNADESLRTGLDSRYQFATPDDPQSSIDMEVFDTGTTMAELKVNLTVNWQISTGKDSGVTFPSHYVLTLENKGGGNYTVSKFAPYYWTEAAKGTE